MSDSDYVYYWLCKIFGTHEDHVKAFGDPSWDEKLNAINTNIINAIQQTNDLITNSKIAIIHLAMGLFL